MVVECPTCHTRYRVDDTLVAGKDHLFQCSLDGCLFNPPPPLTKEESYPTQRENDFSFSTLEEQKEPPFVLSQAEWEKPTPFSLRPFFVLLAALGLSYGAFSLYSLIHPAWIESFLVRLPLVGKVFVADQFSPRKINLINLEGRYQPIEDNKRVFIISGRGVNTAPIAAHSIQVEGRIFNDNGEEVGRKVTFCGNEVSLKLVENLSPHEISVLQKLVPPKHFGVQPAQTTSFLIIFTDPPTNIKEFSCRVVAVQFQRQRPEQERASS